MPKCAGIKRDGGRCAAVVTGEQDYCYAHDPARAEERSRNASRAAAAKHGPIGKELREVRDLILELLGLTLQDGALCSRTRCHLQGIVQLLQCYLRAAELEMRATEEPLKSDLDLKSLKAQVLDRIETLEERERERRELLAGLVPLAEGHGRDAADVRALLRG